MKLFLKIFFLFLSLSACSQTTTNPEQILIPDSTENAKNLALFTELSPVQQAAFNALDKIQVNTDKMNRLYSTFSGIPHSQFPSDTSFVISQSEFLEAMQHFVEKNCTNLSPEERKQLAENSVLAQEEYTLFISLGILKNVDYEHGPPRVGTWIFPEVLYHRDVLIEW